MNGRFKKATRKQAKARIGLDGPAGSGKSFTALRLAFAFPGAKVACIEAGENGGLALYQGQAPDGVKFDFDLLEMKSNFSPSEYTAAIQEAGAAGYDVLVIDSLSHAWAGEGGALEIKDRVGGNDFAAWRQVTPMHNRMIDAILQSPCHVIATLRSKTEYVLEANEKGRMVPVKVGMAPIQRAGMEYEFTIYGSIDRAHVLTVSKSRCPAVQDAIVSKPGASFMVPVIRWLETGEVVEIPESTSTPEFEPVGGYPPEGSERAPGKPPLSAFATDSQARRIGELIGLLGIPAEGVKKALASRGVDAVEKLTTAQAGDMIISLEKKLQPAG